MPSTGKTGQSALPLTGHAWGMPKLTRMTPNGSWERSNGLPGQLSQVIEASAELVIISGFEVKVPARHNP
jgi:hypothetical protein